MLVYLFTADRLLAQVGLLVVAADPPPRPGWQVGGLGGSRGKRAASASAAARRALASDAAL